MNKPDVKRLGTEPIGKLLVGMSSQTTLALFVYAVYSLADTFFVSRGVGPLAAAGVSIASPLLIALGAVATTVGAGGASIVSRALGSKDIEKASRTVAHAFLIFWVAALLVTLFGLLFLDQLVILMGATENILPYARDYGRVILIGAITSTGYSAIVRADGNVRFSTAMWLIPVITNIILDPVFIYIFHLGVTGAAIATVIAQAISACMSIYFFFFKRERSYQMKPAYFRPRLALLKEILLVGMPSFLKNISASLMAVLVNNLLKYMGGDTALSVYAIVGRLYSSLSTPQIGIMQGMQPIAGYNYGLQEYGRVRKTVRLSILTSITYGVFICLLCLAIPSGLLSILSKDTEIIKSGVPALRMMSLAYPISGVALMVTAYFQSNGKVSKAVALSFGGIVAVKIPVMAGMALLFHLNGIWLAEMISELILCMIAMVMLRSCQKSLITQ